MAGILHALGTGVSLLCRGENFLRNPNSFEPGPIESSTGHLFSVDTTPQTPHSARGKTMHENSTAPTLRCVTDCPSDECALCLLAVASPDIASELRRQMDGHGPTVIGKADLASIAKAGDGSLTLTLKDGRTLGGFDCVLFVRRPLALPPSGCISS